MNTIALASPYPFHSSVAASAAASTASAAPAEGPSPDAPVPPAASDDGFAGRGSPSPLARASHAPPLPLHDGDSPAPPAPEAPPPATRREPASAAAAAARAPGAPPPNTDLLAGLGRRFRGPTLRMPFELRTTVARQIFRRDFVYVSQQLHALEASRRVPGLSRDSLNEALASIGRRIDAARTLLLRSTEQMRELIDLHGHAGADVEFARPTQLLATIVSPYARDYMDVLVHADTALGELERAWLLGLIEPIEKGRLAADCRKAVQGVKEMVRQQRTRVGTLVRELNAHRAQAGTEDEPSAETGASASLAHDLAEVPPAGALAPAPASAPAPAAVSPAGGVVPQPAPMPHGADVGTFPRETHGLGGEASPSPGADPRCATGGHPTTA